jgi:hypothetical protein
MEHKRGDNQIVNVYCFEPARFSLPSSKKPGILIPHHLHALGLTRASEWDALSFLSRHAVSLGTAAQIARSIGYDSTEIGEALRRLEALGLIQRSRVSGVVRIYRFKEPPEPARRACLRELLDLAQNRTGRLLLLGYLKHLQSDLAGKRQSGLHLA